MEAGPENTTKALPQAIALPKVATQIEGLDELLTAASLRAGRRLSGWCGVLFGAAAENSFAGVGISSLVATVILLRFAESGGMLHWTLRIRQVRGAAHSTQCHEFRITNRGLELLGIYTGSHDGYPHS